MTCRLAPLLERNKRFASTDAKLNVPAVSLIPRMLSFVITCVDPRVDPAAFLGLELGDAFVLRNVGGRVTPSALQDVSYMSYLLETRYPDGPFFEFAVIHHTDCGSRFLADEGLRHDFAERTGSDEHALAQLPVLDPALSVRTDVDRLVTSPGISPKIRVSGYVYDVKTGLVTPAVEPISVRGD